MPVRFIYNLNTSMFHFFFDFMKTHYMLGARSILEYYRTVFFLLERRGINMF